MAVDSQHKCGNQMKLTETIITFMMISDWNNDGLFV